MAYDRTDYKVANVRAYFVNKNGSSFGKGLLVGSGTRWPTCIYLAYCRSEGKLTKRLFGGKARKVEAPPGLRSGRAKTLSI